MSEETPIVDTQPVDDNLADFSNEFFQMEEPKSPASDPEKVEEIAPEKVEDAQDEVIEDDALATEEDDTEEEEVEEPAPKKKSRFQERIDELTAKARESERREQAALDRIAALESGLKKDENPTQKTQEVVQVEGPDSRDKNEDGTDKYPLGEFDPRYIKDVVAHTLKVERQLAEVAAQEKSRNESVQAAQQELQSKWNDSLEVARERYPDFQEKGQSLISSFDGLDPNYGEYLSTTIMSMDYGTDVLYYLANNPDEAKKIAQSGAQKATIALGRLEAKFADAEETKQKARPIVSSAPPPPPRNKGSSAAGGVRVRGDEDDLDAVSRALFSG